MARTKRERIERATLTAPPRVVIDGLTRSYDEYPILRDISVTAEPGRTLVVMGPSGVGKTTLVRLILGFDQEPDAGTVHIDGHDVLDVEGEELRALRRGIAALLGGSSNYDSGIFSSMTAWENVRYPLEQRGHDTAVIDERAWERMVEFELTDYLQHKPPDLSAGTKRRLALARTFVDDAPLVVLDDPGGATDLVNRTKIIESIRRAKASTEATMILTCHDIEMARTLGDDMVVLLGGRVVAAGPVSELLDGVVDAETYDERFRVKDHFAISDASENSTMHRVKDDVREQSSWAWAVYLVLGIMALATFIALMTGVINNVFTW